MGAVEKAALSVVGAAVLASGSVAVFVSTNSTGTAALIGAGVLLIALAVFGDRIESVEGVGLKLQLAAASKFIAATEADAAGDAGRAARLREEGRHLLDTARSISDEYSTIRATEASGAERTARMDRLIRRRAPQLAEDSTPEEVSHLFRTGEEGNRVLALGVMATDPALADVGAITEAIRSSRTAFEQYHALCAAAALADSYPETPGMGELRDAVEEALVSSRLRKDASRRHVAEQFLDRLR